MQCLFFFNDTATTEIYTLSLHDALPICGVEAGRAVAELEAASIRQGDVHPGEHRTTSSPGGPRARAAQVVLAQASADRKSTRLNSSHANISYAVFCLKKKTYHVYQHLA